MQNQIIEMYEAARKFARKYGSIGLEAQEDIVQMTMMRLIARNELPRTIGYVYYAVRSTAIEAARRSVREQSHRYQFASEEGYLDFETAIERVIASSNSMPDNQVEVDLMPRIKDMLGKLRQPLREVLVLYVEGHSYGEIAALLNVNIGTVKSRLHYARKRARKLLPDVA